MSNPTQRYSLWQRFVTTLFPALGALDDEGRREHGRWLERRFQSVMVTLCTAGLIWGVQTLASLDKRTELLALQIAYLQAGSARAESLRADVVQIRDGVTVLQRRVESMDSRIADLERHAAIATKAVR